MTEDEPVWLTYREAARRVHRTRRAIRYWRQRGMPMSWDTRAGQRCRVVEETTLLAWWRDRMKNDPVYQQKLRKKLAEEALLPGAIDWV